MKSFLFTALFMLAFQPLWAQNGTIRGTVVDKLNHQPVPFAPVGIVGTTLGAASDGDGRFEIKGVAPGIYNLQVNVLGYKPITVYEVAVTASRTKVVEIELEEQSKDLGEVEVRPDPFVKIEGSPVSQFTVGEVEIKRNPGSNRDISKALQSLPGVAATASFRNDLIIRGGSTYENRFFLDGVEVPNINHFSTQGATGGPVGMINVDLIREVDFYSAAFPSSRGNALSSVLDFKLKDGSSEKTGGSVTLGATDVGVTLNGPIGSNVNYTASWRRSYLQFLFQALGLPFLPRYDDYLFKSKIKLDDKNEITILGLGANDVVTLNKKDNETDFQQYVLNYLPENTQWNYTVGAVYKHYGRNGYSTLAISRNALQNGATKYAGNDATNPSGLLLNYDSRETENKSRIEHTARIGKVRLTGGASLESGRYTTSTYNRIPYVGTVNYVSEVEVIKYGAFATATSSFSDDRFTLSLGFRVDGNGYNSTMSNPLRQWSPRASFSWKMSDHFRFNANAGRYYQLPPYTVLGYRDSTGTLVNESDVRYMQCDHLVGGFEYTNDHALRVTLEFFDKQYSQYPIDLRDSISIANLGNDFGVIGNTPVRCDGKGRSRGFELMVQQKFTGNFYGILAYTFLHSEFQNLSGAYSPSSWDFRHTLSLTGGYYFKRNWEFGARFRYNSGQPYTPFDMAATLLRSNWDVSGVGIPDKYRINEGKTPAFQQLDVRVDKKYYFKKWSLDLYLDIQNVLNHTTVFQPYISVQRDDTGAPVVDPNDPSRYLSLMITNESGTVIPTFGFVVEF